MLISELQIIVENIIKKTCKIPKDFTGFIQKLITLNFIFDLYYRLVLT